MIGDVSEEGWRGEMYGRVQRKRDLGSDWEGKGVRIYFRGGMLK